MILKLSLSQMLYNAIFQFTTLFINTYLFKEHRSIPTVALYNISIFFFWGFFFFAGFRFNEKSTRIGQAFSGATSALGIILLLMHVNNPVFLGLLTAASGGFFWSSYNAMYRSIGSSSQNGGTFAKVSLLATVVTVFVPMFFGHLVEGSGYTAGFVILLVLSALLILMSRFVPDVRTQRTHLRRSTFRHRSFINANLIQGFYYAFANLAVGLLVYMTGQSEAGMGSFATYYGLVSVLVTFTMAYLLPKKWKVSLMLSASVLYILSSFLFFHETRYTVILLNFVMAFAQPLFNNPSVGFNFAYLNERFHNPAEGIFLREVTLCTGRLVMYVYMLLFGFQVGTTAFFIMLVLVSLFPALITLIMQNWRGKDEVSSRFLRHRRNPGFK